jgi:hypothetical protein
MKAVGFVERCKCGSRKYGAGDTAGDDGRKPRTMRR